MAILGSGGDVFPMIAFGRAMLARGHQVLLVSSPHFGPNARAVGLGFQACVSDEDESRGLRNPNPWKTGGGFRVLFNRLLDAVPGTYRIIAAHHMPGRTVIIANAPALAARIARETLGGPFVTVHLQPILLRSRNHQPGLMVSKRWTPVIRAMRTVLLPVIDRWIFDPAIAPRLNQFRATLGLPPVRRVFAGWIHSPDLVLGLFPEWFARPEPDWPAHTHLIGFPPLDLADTLEEDPELDAFLDAGPPPIVFTLGTAMRFARRFFEASVEACRLTGRRGLMFTPFPEQLPPLPDTVRHCRLAPFARVLPRTAGLVHHGGIGTMAAAFAAGIPQIAVPFNFDQPDNAARLLALGAGAVIRPAAYVAQTVARTLNDLLTSAPVLAKCQSLAALIRAADPMRSFCDLVEATADLAIGAGARQPS
jgi:rhamnosyltransferase subunit B